MVIDFHTHCFPEKIAERAVKSLAETAGLINYHNGTYESLSNVMREQGVDKFVVLNIATNPKQQHNVNDFAISINNNGGIAFGSVHPDAPDALDELERLKAAGIKGVKFHAEYQNFYVDDEKMKPIYRKISELGLITVFHAGMDLGFLPPYHASPVHTKFLPNMIDSPIVLAHWGASNMPIEVIDTLAGLPVYFDLSFGYQSVPLPLARKIVEKHGVDRLLFGTDCPWHTPDIERRLIEAIGFSEEEKLMVYGGNAEKLLFNA